MAHTAVVTFTAKNRRTILADGGSRDWRLDADRARRSEFLVCTQNCHHADADIPDVPHAAAFLIGRIDDVVPSPQDPHRWLIRISEYLECNIPNIWGKSGHARYPVRYTTLEALGIDLDRLPPFYPTPGLGDRRGMAEMRSPPLVPPPLWQPQSIPQAPVGPDAWARLDAILHQIDRIPDLPSHFDPLEWDANGLPQ